MGKDSGGGQAPPTQQTVTQTNLPDYAQPYFSQLMQTSAGLAQQPYPTYQGQRLAQLAPNQQAAIYGAGQLGTSLPSQIQTGTNFLQQAGLGALNTGFQPSQITNSFAPTQFNAPAFDQSQANSYMSPYVQGALNPALNELQRQSDINASNIGNQAAAQGALGGYRQGIQLSENQRNTDVLKSNLLGQGYQSAFQNAQQQFNADQARQLQAQQLASQQGQFGAQLGLQTQQQNIANQLASQGLGLQGLQTAGGIGSQLGQIGATQYGLGLQGLNALQTTGALAQQQQQSALDLGYSDFMNSMLYPEQQANFFSGILHGVPVTPTANVQQWQAPPSPYSQLLGLGIAGAGIGKLVGG